LGRQIKKYDIGTVHKSKRCGKFEIIDNMSYNKRNIRFLNTKFEKIVQVSSISNGSIIDPLCPSVCGVGIVGVDNINVHKEERKRCYGVWRDMISRCYSKTCKNYKNVTVCNEWHNFQNFAVWFYDNYIKGYDLDKDLLSDVNNKIYSPSTCIFIPHKINVFIAFINEDRGLYFRKDIKKYRVNLNSFTDNKGIHVGYFKNKEYAKNQYRIHKNIQIDEVKKYMKELEYDDYVIEKLCYI